MFAARRSSVVPWLAAAAFLLLAYAADGVQKRSWRQAVVALDAGEAAAVCAAAGFPLSGFWERAKAMGVGAMVLRPQTLRDLAERGEVLVFAREELEKWKSLGLLTPNAAIRTNVLWVKDRKIFPRVAASLRSQGLVVSTGASAGHGIIELSHDPAPETSAGFNPEDVDSAASLGLAPVSGLSLPAAARVLEPSARLPGVLRAIYSQPGRLLVLRLDPAAGVEENLSHARSLLRPLRERGLVGREWPPGPDLAREPRGVARWRRWLAWLLAVLGPIAAVRFGVKGFKRAQRLVLERRPVASPVAELVGGVLAAAAAAAAAGLAVGLLLAGSSAARLPESLAFSTMAWPLAIGALALYPFSAKALMRGLRASPTYWDILGLAALTLAAALLLRPRAILAGTPLWGWLQSAADGPDWLWWWPWRWREIFVGLPALVHALYLVGRRIDVPEPRAGRGALLDPRPWLWLGLLFPIGTIAALGRPGIPAALALGQTAAVLLAGLILGGFLLAVRAVWERRVQSRKPVTD